MPFGDLEGVKCPEPVEYCTKGHYVSSAVLGTTETMNTLAGMQRNVGPTMCWDIVPCQVSCYAFE